ncbi:MAG: HAMP domain-containing sensor histidine kinase [Bacteroidetes bacterium]|nr:HAMP domain-containing sensor histidine kinase [Bacteroidota bacterium]
MKLYSKTPINKATSDRTHVLSHELRTPLAIIGGYAQVLRDELDPALKELVTPILENVDRLSHVIGALLSWDSIDTETTPSAENCDIMAVVGSVVERLKPTVEAKSLQLEWSGPESRLASYASVEQIRSVTTELISNAIKFSENGRIQIQISATSSSVSLEVIDEGIGVTGNIQRLFEPFVQGSVGLNRQFDGLGLGLTLARKKAREISGTVTLENGIGKGAIATFTFPRFAQSSKKIASRSRAA